MAKEIPAFFIGGVVPKNAAGDILEILFGCGAVHMQCEPAFAGKPPRLNLPVESNRIEKQTITATPPKKLLSPQQRGEKVKSIFEYVKKAYPKTVTLKAVHDHFSPRGWTHGMCSGTLYNLATVGRLKIAAPATFVYVPQKG